MRERIHIATFAEGATTEARRAGFGLEINDTCISNDLEPAVRKSLVSRIQAEIADAGAEGRNNTLHGPFTEITPDAMDDRIIALLKERCTQAAEVCQSVGITRMVMHSGYDPLMYHRSWHMERSLRFWNEMLGLLPDNIEICIENVFEDDPHILREVVEGIHSPRVHACLDIGHAACMTDKKYSLQDWMDVLLPVLGHMHLHNNDGKKDLHDDLDRGIVPMEDILQQILPLSSVTLTLEMRSAHNSCLWLEDFLRRQEKK